MARTRRSLQEQLELNKTRKELLDAKIKKQEASDKVALLSRELRKRGSR